MSLFSYRNHKKEDELAQALSQLRSYEARLHSRGAEVGQLQADNKELRGEISELAENLAHVRINKGIFFFWVWGCTFGPTLLQA